MARSIHRITLLTTFALMLGGFGCSEMPSEPEFDNPIIPDDPTYVPPQTTIIAGPAEGAVIDTHTVTFTWAGNQAEMTFAYRLYDEIWSGWASDTSVTFANQDEGDYLFEVKGQYLSGIEEDTSAFRNYTIDDIHGPALWLYPRYQEVDQGRSFTVEIMLEEVDNVFAVKAVLEFDPSKLQVSDVEVYEDSRSLLKSNGGTVIPFSSYDNAAGNVTIEVAMATGNPPGVDGTGPIAQITLTTIQAGHAEIIVVTTSEIRDPDNNNVSVSEMVQATVMVQ